MHICHCISVKHKSALDVCVPCNSEYFMQVISMTTEGQREGADSSHSALWRVKLSVTQKTSNQHAILLILSLLFRS